MDWSLFHAINAGVATRDWLEDPVTALAPVTVPLFAAAVVGLWFLARPYGDLRWKLASASGLGAAALALAVNQLVSHLWERPRPFVAHGAAAHLLAAPSPDPSFPSDHAAAAFAIAFGVYAFSRRAGIGFLVVATLVALSRVSVGLHYPSDVVAGAVVGWASALAVTRLAAAPVERLVGWVSRLSDPLLAPGWAVARRRASQR